MTGIVLIGGGGHCRAAIDVIEAEGRFAVAGIVERPGAETTAVLGYPVLGTDDALDDILAAHPVALVTIGQIASAAARIRCFAAARTAGADLPVVCAPMSYRSRHSSLGAGSILMHGAIANAGAEIGENCILNSQCLVEHDARIGDHCHVSTGARVNGNVTLGEGCFIGSGAIIHQGVSIGRGSVIGAGCVIRSDLPEETTIRETPRRAPS